MKPILKKTRIACVPLLLCIACCAWSGSVRVPEDYSLIQDAISGAEEGDSILVARGIYPECGLRFSGKAVTLVSEEGPVETSIDAAQSDRIFLFDESESQNTKISGFTIRNGSSNGDGGAILCKGASPSFDNCIIEGNSATAHNGGGLSCRDYASPSFVNCIFRNNKSVHLGGGVYCSNHSSPMFSSSLFENNSAGEGLYDGGGIFCSNHSNPDFAECIIRGNTAMNGAGVYCLNFSSPLFKSCIFLRNIAGCGGGGAACFFYSNPGFVLCTFAENESARHSSYGYDAGGGVICAYGSSPDFRGCIITKNSSYNGGGIDCIGNASPRFINCFITENYADTDGGGLRINVESNLTLYYCTVSGNKAGTEELEPDRGYGGGLRVNKANAKIVNTIFYDNSAKVDGDEIYLGSGNINMSYSNIRGGWPGTGNIDVDPSFMSNENSNYHLKAGSRCIDQGRVMPTIDVDFEGDTRPAFKTRGCDIGADEVVLFGDEGDQD